MIKQLFQLIHCTVALTQCQPGTEDDLYCIQSEEFGSGSVLGFSVSVFLGSKDGDITSGD